MRIKIYEVRKTILFSSIRSNIRNFLGLNSLFKEWSRLSQLRSIWDSLFLEDNVSQPHNNLLH